MTPPSQKSLYVAHYIQKSFTQCWCILQQAHTIWMSSSMWTQQRVLGKSWTWHN